MANIVELKNQKNTTKLYIYCYEWICHLCGLPKKSSDLLYQCSCQVITHTGSASEKGIIVNG